MSTSRVLLFSDSIVATRRDTVPLFEWPCPLGEDRIFDTSKSYVPDVEAGKLRLQLGQGFAFIDHQALQFVVLLNVEATVAADHCHRSVTGAPEVWQVGQARNLAQFNPCALKSLFSETNDKHSNALMKRQALEIELCRLAMLKFSDFVLLPTPETYDIKPYLVKSLRTALEDFDTCGCDGKRDFVTWVVTL